MPVLQHPNNQPVVILSKEYKVTVNGNSSTTAAVGDNAALVNDIDLTGYTWVAMYLLVDAFTAGAAPTAQLQLSEISPFKASSFGFGPSAQFTLIDSTAKSAGAQFLGAAGPGMGGQNVLIGQKYRLFWTLAGAPTDATFRVVLIGRS